jgi:hypothetical protein
MMSKRVALSITWWRTGLTRVQTWDLRGARSFHCATLTAHATISLKHLVEARMLCNPSPQPNGLWLLELHCSPLQHNWLQLEHPWLLLVLLASTGSPCAAHWYYWNTLGNTPGVTYFNVDEIRVTIGFRHWITLGFHWLPLNLPLATTEFPLAFTTGTPLETPLAWGEGSYVFHCVHVSCDMDITFGHWNWR